MLQEIKETLRMKRQIGILLSGTNLTTILKRGKKRFRAQRAGAPGKFQEAVRASRLAETREIR